MFNRNVPFLPSGLGHSSLHSYDTMATPLSAARSSHTEALLRDALVWDDHGCMPLRPNDTSFLPQLARYAQAGFNIVSLNVGFDAVPWENTVRMLAQFRHWVRQHPGEYLLIESVDDVLRAQAQGKLGVTFDIEGGCALVDQLSMVELYYELGVRWMLIAYNRNNALGGGCQDDDHGLTAFGRQVLDEMARVGMIVCCSHTGWRTTMDVMSYSKNPVIFSHSNPQSMWSHKRNIRDDVIKACAGTGGVVGINGIGSFLGQNDTRTETLVRHIDYVVNLVGARHVGLGFDYVFDRAELDEYLINHPEMFPPSEGYSVGMSMVEPEQLADVVEQLVRMGYSDEDMHGILGGNHLRVARRVWK
jgi:membrane dipeptidase